MVNMKLNNKENEALRYIIYFLDKIKEFKDENKIEELNDFILEYSYNCRMMNIFGCEPNQSAMFLALNYINMMIPSLFREKGSTSLEFAQEFDKKVNDTFMEKFKNFIKTDEYELTNNR